VDQFRYSGKKVNRKAKRLWKAKADVKGGCLG